MFLSRSPSDPGNCHLWAGGQSSSCVPQSYESHSFLNQHGVLRTVLSITSCLCQNWTLRLLVGKTTSKACRGLPKSDSQGLTPYTETFIQDFSTLKYYCIICNICKNDNFVNKFNTTSVLWIVLLPLWKTFDPNCQWTISHVGNRGRLHNQENRWYLTFYSKRYSEVAQLWFYTQDGAVKKWIYNEMRYWPHWVFETSMTKITEIWSKFE